jgi:hypothetical protein
MIFYYLYYNKMPPRRKKSTAKKNAGISINIKNILRQTQNEKPDNFIMLSSKRQPFANNLNNGNMSRLQVPAMTYASRPLSQFPSLSSVSNIDRGFAPPLSQLSSKAPVPRPDILQVETNPYDIELSQIPVKMIRSNPLVPSSRTPSVSSIGYNSSSPPSPLLSSMGSFFEPSAPTRLLSAYPVSEGKEDQQDVSEMAVASTMDKADMDLANEIDDLRNQMEEVGAELSKLRQSNPSSPHIKVLQRQMKGITQRYNENFRRFSFNQR